MMHIHVCLYGDSECADDLTALCGEHVERTEWLSGWGLNHFLTHAAAALATVTCPACLVCADEILEKGKL